MRQDKKRGGAKPRVLSEAFHQMVKTAWIVQVGLVVSFLASMGRSGLVAEATTVPAAPSNVTASPASSSAIGISWVNNSNDQTGYRVERSTNGPGGRLVL